MLNLKKYKPCDDCAQSEMPGYVKDERGNVSECACLQLYSKYVHFYKYLSGVGVPNSYLDYNISEYYGNKSKKALETMTKLVGNIKEFVDNKYQAYLYGEPRTQKTSAAIYILKQAAKQGITVAYVTMPNLFGVLKKSNLSKDKDTLLDYDGQVTVFKNAEILVIDNAFDPELIYFGNSNYGRSLLADFFQGREGSNIFVSRWEKWRIKLDYFGSFFGDYLKQNCAELAFLDELPQELLNKGIDELLK